MTSTNSQFEKLRCIKRVDVNQEISTFEFEHLDQRPFQFQAGQFLTFEINYFKKLLYRAYSICSAPQHKNSVTVAIKRVPGGKISNYLVDNLRAGHALPAMDPAGTFTREANQCSDNIVLMSAGSGVTPCLAIAQDVLASDPHAHVHFIHSARRSSDLVMAEQLNALAEQHANFRISLVLTAEQEADHFYGRLDSKMFAQLLPDVSQQTIFICGPTQYMSSIESIALASGFDMDHFHKESFVAAAAPGETARSDINHQVSVPSLKKSFMINDQQNLLDALQSAGVKVPYSCKAGVCGACKCKVTGEVESSSRVALSDEQVEQGYVLTCCSKANSDLAIEL